MHELQKTGVAFTIPEMMEQRNVVEGERAAYRKAIQDAERSVEWSVIDPATGIVKRSGVGQFQDLARQAKAGEVVIEGRIADDTHMVEFGPKGMKVVKRPPPDIRADQVKRVCRERILNRYSVEDQLNAPYEGYEAEMRQWIEAMRQRCKEIEAMQPIPLDYDTDTQWPEAPK